MAELKLKPETYECVGVKGIIWDCYWAWEGEKEVDGEYFPETFCRFGYPLCTPCKICKYYVRRDKIDDYIHHLLDEIEILTKLP